MIDPNDYMKQWNLPSLDHWMKVEFPQLLEAYTITQGHSPEPQYEWSCFQTYRRYCEPNVWTFEKMLWHEQGEPPVNPNSGPIVHLVTSGPILRERDSNVAHRVKSVSGFNLCDLYAKGQDIDTFLVKYSRSNRVRIFCYTPVKDWGSNAWSFPQNEVLHNFIEHLINKKFATSICLLTDDDPSQVGKAKDLINYLNQFDFPGLLLEGVNEPLTHDKTNPNELKNALSSSRHLWGSGIYEDLKQFFGKIGYYHSPRDNEGPRKSKDTIEAYRGGGPNSSDEPACKVPWLLDEPFRPDQALAWYNSNDVNSWYHTGNRENKVKLDYYAYGAMGSKSSTGITFHCESAKLSKLPSDFEYECYNALMNGMNIYPNDAPLGDYEHLRDLEEVDSNGNPTTCLRVFRVGRYVTVIRPKSVKIPGNWKSLDNYSVCYEIV